MAQALDARLSEPYSYIQDGQRLLLVLHVRWLGEMPTRRRETQTEDARTGELVTLTDKKLEAFHFVCRAPSDNEIMAENRRAVLAEQAIDPVAA